MVQTLNSPIPIKKAGDSPFIRILLYGNSGIGKTTFLATLQDNDDTFPAIVLDAEKGTTSIAGTDIDVVEVQSTRALNVMHEYLLKDGNYKAVVIDSLSQVYANILLDLIKEGNDSGRRQSYQIDTLELQDYNKALNKLITIIRAFKMLNKHLIFTCLAKEESTAKEGLIRMPDLAGKLGNSIGQYVDAMIYLTKDGEGKRVAITQETKGIRAKFRVPFGQTAPTTIPEPTMTKFLQVKNGTYK